MNYDTPQLSPAGIASELIQGKTQPGSDSMGAFVKPATPPALEADI